MTFVARRLGFYAFTLWAAVTANFAIPRLMPGNPLQAATERLGGQLTAAQTHQLSALYGLGANRGLLGQYGSYLVQLLRGHLGVSIAYFPTSVGSVIASSLPWTVCLVGAATLVSFAVGTSLGVLAGWRRGSWLDSLLPATTVLSTVPYFWIGLLALSVFGVTLHWLPISGGAALGTSPSWSWSFVASALSHAVLPAGTIVLASVGGWLVAMRNMMVTTAHQDYMLLAEAKGLPERRRMVAYAARNAMLPNLANFAVSMGAVVGGSILTEVVFSYPGIGYVLFRAVAGQDYPLMQGIFLVITLTVLTANFLADLAYAMLDPRTRQERP